mgnify:CR=1 FL=1|tara:strand:+ start:347 stop:649 length:303 start_codon:yes stop_codon:yes gene_type:complete
MNTTNTKEPFTQDPKLAKSIADCKKAFAKWELDKARKEHVNPAKIRLKALSKFDKIVLVTVGIYVVWVLVALYQMSYSSEVDYIDSPIEIPNSTNTTNIT